MAKPATTIEPGELFCAAYKPVPTDDATPEYVQLVIDDNNQACVTLGCAACSQPAEGPETQENEEYSGHDAVLAPSDAQTLR